MTKALKALGALLVLAVLIGGIPLALLTFYGNPIPQELPSLGDVLTLFTSTDTIAFFIFVIVWIGWIAWATFTLSVVLEIIARARHISAPKIPVLGAQQGAAAVLIAAIAGVGAPAAMADSPTDVPAQSPHVETLVMPAEHASTETPSADQTTASHADEEKDLVVTVKPGDTAWDLAEQHLGSGNQWQKIIDANAGKPQPDGGTLTAGTAQHLEPGWKLTIPGVPAPSHAKDSHVQHYDTVTVEEGQTLSSIAAEHLGDADRWPEIFEASTGVTQPGGHELTNPDAIDTGWTLHVPAKAASTEHTTPTMDHEPAPESASAQDKEAQTEAALEAAGAATDELAQALPAPAAPQQTDDEASVPWVGVGSIFAASLLSALIARRLYTRRKRRADQRIPEAATIDLDQVRLTRIVDDGDLGFVDRALRTLAALELRDEQTLPDVRFARLTDTHLELYAAEAHELPEPFEATEDPATWLLSRTAPLADDETLADIVAPYPALVTIGTDSEGFQILVDLEHLAALGIHASTRTSMPVMRALTVSLATSQWADDLTLTTVGVCPELESALGSGRISYRESVEEMLDDLEAKLARDQEALTELGHDSAQHARQASDATDLWAPEIIIIGTDLSLTEKRRLQAIVDARPQIAVAVISSDQHTDLSEWRMHIESLEAARLEPLGLELAPQHLTDEDYDAVLRALGATEALETVPAEEAVPEEPAELPAPQLHAIPGAPEPAGTILTAQQRDTDPELPAEHPYIRLLGPIEVLGATGPIEDKRVAELTETVTYIHLCPGRSETTFRADLWPGKRVADSTRHQRISRARKWLGESEDGTRYLPRAAGTDGAYSLDEHVTSDWAYVQQVLESRSEATNEQLAEALKLVRGTPFADGGRNRYRWTITTFQDQMIDAILDLATELAQRALAANDMDTALWATERGLVVESLHEQLWRYRLQAASHDPELHEHITRDLEALLAETAGTDYEYELMAETEALMYTTPTPHRIAI